MDRSQVESILRRLKAGTVSVGDAMESLRSLPFEELGFATVDTHRSMRRGFPEAVYGAGKTDAQVSAILERLSRTHRTLRATRIPVLDAISDGTGAEQATHKRARARTILRCPLMRACRALRKLPLKLEQVLEEVIAPLRR